MRPPPLPRTVIIDYYDSYTNNLLTLFTRLYSDDEVLKKVVVIKADRYTWEEFQNQVLAHVDCIILSPGPGRPDTPSDIGFALELLRQHPVPILGVCLGHQAIGVAFGGKIINMPKITHGHVVPISPIPGKGLFGSLAWVEAGEGEFEVVVYNSLTVDPESLPADLEVTAWSASSGGQQTIQGLAHKEFPIWGVQYHPESISSTRGRALLQAFLHATHTHHSSPKQYAPLPEHIISSCAYRVSAGSSRGRMPLVSPTPFHTPPVTPNVSSAALNALAAEGGSSLRLVDTRFGELGREAKTENVFEALIYSGGDGKGEETIGDVWLDGQTPTRATNTSMCNPSFLLTYTLSSRTITLHRPARPPVHLELRDETFWDLFSAAHSTLSARLQKPGRSTHAWRGGWVGWFGYEMKQEALAGYRRRDKTAALNGCGGGGDADVGEVDAAWAWCDRVLERSKEGEWVARAVVREAADESMEPNEADAHANRDTPLSLLAWLAEQGVIIGVTQDEAREWTQGIATTLHNPVSNTLFPADSFPPFQPRSDGADYRSRIDQCREAIRQGESYELTLTTAFTSTLSSSKQSQSQTPPSPHTPISLYLRQRKHNPAYYSTFISFPTLRTPRGNGVTVLSSSPERFLRIDEGVVEMMPIKGTRARVKPGVCVCEGGKGCEGRNVGSEECVNEAKEVDRRIGEELSRDPKERAENLMIVDLIRSDLLSCCTPSSVVVPKLIALESYGVHNLVTTVRGMVAGNVGTVEAVRRCFPPGSMTGAPKLRSVQLLEGFESEPRRGIYAGALGYFSLDGTTDLSVVIRTMVLEGDQLTLGAGGAITWLSDPEGEWDEVLTKVKSVVGRVEGV